MGRPLLFDEYGPEAVYQVDLVRLRGQDAVFDDRNLLRLLRYDNDHRIGLFTQSDRRPVPRSIALIDKGILRQGENTACRQDTAVADNDASIMQRRDRHENRDQQFTGQSRVEFDPGLDKIAQAGLPFDDDQGADPAFGQVLHRANDLIEILIGEIHVLLERRLADLGQGAADILLKHDDDDQKDGAQEILQQPHERGQIENLGEGIDDGQNDEAEGHLHRTGSPDDRNQLIYDKSDNEDIDDILPAVIIQKIHHREETPSVNA